MSWWPCTSLYSSRHIRPATAAVVVAMAGMIFPAMSLLCEPGGKANVSMSAYCVFTEYQIIKTILVYAIVWFIVEWLEEDWA